MKQLLFATVATVALVFPAMGAENKPLPNYQVQSSPEHPAKPEVQTHRVPQADIDGNAATRMNDGGTVGAAPALKKGDETPTIRYDRPQQNDPEKQ